MRRHFHGSLSFLIILTASAILVAQISVDVRLVNVIATVTDDRGRYVGNLAAEDFFIEEDGRPQKVSHFSQDNDVPISVGVLLDTSGSMERKLRTAVDAVDRFADRIHKDDEIFLMTFANEPILRQDFTNDRNKLFHSMHKMLPTGGTALYDALSEGLAKIRLGRHDKRAILLITDGQPSIKCSGQSANRNCLYIVWASHHCRVPNAPNAGRRLGRFRRSFRVNPACRSAATTST